jgi:hypothetical protein
VKKGRCEIEGMKNVAWEEVLKNTKSDNMGSITKKKKDIMGKGD